MCEIKWGVGLRVVLGGVEKRGGRVTSQDPSHVHISRGSILQWLSILHYALDGVSTAQTTRTGAASFPAAPIQDACMHLPWHLPLVVLHVRSRGVELQVALDDLVHRSQKVLLSRHLPPRADGKHAGLGGDTSQLGARAVGA
jgi:hypothetical protein